ncbi:Polynucleotide 5'-hydroxyl-kinase grc3 [Orbilia oligospora]|uniref:Polynucleotide 5'-hydroxyl-kinase GRC3 n=1 Tax=Orbilia oligospora TaxID=2813651 RepID=A0A7C8UDT6_ORBOL|nr:Polynucleotide 5'-hydroxyl-kinase grc3 [Orbilia oligospora]
MSKRTSDSKVKAPLSALAARRLRQQQLAAQAEPSNPNSNADSPAITPGAEAAPTFHSKDIPNISPSTPLKSRSPFAIPPKESIDSAPDSDIDIPRQISNFVQTEDNYVYDTQTLETTVKLRRGETFVIQGEYRISVISGNISICGAVIETSVSLDVIAPSTQALPVIECAPKSKKRKVEKQARKDGGIWKPPLTSTIVKSRGSDSFTPILMAVQPTPVLALPPSWQPTITALSSTKQSPKSIFIVGGKSVGKSTFSRYLLNNLITNSQQSSVAYLDLDPGQPSFTPPCILSLHKITSPILAPSFATFGFTEIVRQHHVGYISPREDPKYYLRCAADLMREYRRLVEQGENLTLIINTCGWIKGMGRELLHELVAVCGPTDVVGLGDVDGVFAEILPEGKGVKRHTLEAAGTGNAVGNTPGSQQFTPADLRILQTIAYFHQRPKVSGISISSSSPSFDFEKHLTAVPPLIAAYKGATKVIHGVTILDTGIAPDLIFTALNATIVSIKLVKNDDREHPAIQYLENTYDENNGVPPYIPANQFDGTSGLLTAEGTVTAGLAIIRGVDEASGELQLLMPMHEDEINGYLDDGYKILLCRGRDEMPVYLMWDWRDGRAGQKGRRGTGGGGGVDKMPYLDFVDGGEVTGKGAKEWKVRRNIMRRGQQRR